MEVDRVVITNFRAISDTVPFYLRPFNVLVGQNDVGKSTILKALDLFLGSELPNDAHPNRRTGNPKITIDLALSPSNTPIVIDEAIGTTFAQEGLTDQDGRVVIRKEWDTSKARATPDLFIMRRRFDDGDFLLYTEAQLIKLCKDRGIQTHKANGEAFNNVEKRQKLAEHYLAEQRTSTFTFEKLPTSGDSRGKRIRDAISAVLPRYQFFKADTSLAETDAAIQSYFRDVAEKALESADTRAVEDPVRETVGRVFTSITDKINRVLPAPEQVTPRIDFDWAKLVKTSFATARDGLEIPLSLRGDGFRRITMMAYFEHLAEEQNPDSRQLFFAFEEPETFLHPNAQESLFDKLADLASTGYQVILSTHSPIIVARTDRSDLTHITRVGGGIHLAHAPADHRAIADDLGIRLENQFLSLFDKASLLLLVEGIDDARALKHSASLYKTAGLIPQTFDELNVLIFPTQGKDTINHWLTLDILTRLSKPYFIFFDSDKKSADEPSPTRAQLEQLGFQEGRDFLVTRKRTLENYIPESRLKQLVPAAEITYGDWDDVKRLCKQNEYAGLLGGKNVAERHFESLTIDDLRDSYGRQDDEFILLYNSVRANLQ